MILTFYTFQIIVFLTSYNHNQDKEKIYKLTPTLTLGFEDMQIQLHKWKLSCENWDLNLSESQ